MSLPQSLQNTFTPSELEFQAQSQKIFIIPRQQLNPIDLITTDIPRARAMQRMEIPIWTALILKQTGKCSVVPPEWLSVVKLTEFYKFEVANNNKFSTLPDNWLEISKIIFENAADDLVHNEVPKLKGLIQDLKEIRRVKVKKGLSMVNPSHLQMDNLSRLEINEIRPFIVEIMDKLTDLEKAVNQEEEEEEGYDREDDDIGDYDYQKE